MFVGDTYEEAIQNPPSTRRLAECTDLAREFPGLGDHVEPDLGYRAVRGDDRIGPCTSRSAVSCMLAVTELHRMSA